VSISTLVGAPRPDLATGLDPGPVGQPDVHHDDVGLEGPGAGDRFGDAAGLGDDLEVVVGLEHGPQAAADDLVVVDEQDAHRHVLVSQ
jgi:hypothetical protein